MSRKLADWPQLYDISLDEMRDVTQADVDQMMRKILELTSPWSKITDRPEGQEPWLPHWPRLWTGEIEDGGRNATVGILI